MVILEKERKMLGLTQKELAEKIGVSVTTIQAYVKNVFKPSAKTAPRMKELGFSDTACLDPSKEIEV